MTSSDIMDFVGHVLRGQSLCKQILMSTNFTQQRGRSKSFLKQLAEDLVRVQQITGTSTIAQTILDRNRYRTACVERIRELGELGRHRCLLMDAGKNTSLMYHTSSIYKCITRPSFRLRQQLLLTRLSTFPTEAILQSDPLAPRFPRRSARNEARRLRQLQQANLTVG